MKNKKAAVKERPIEKAQKAVTSIVAIEQSHQALIISHTERAKQLFKEVIGNGGKFVVLGDQDFEFVNELLGFVKAAHKEIDGRRKLVTAPLDQALRAFRSWYKPPLDFYKKIETVLKGALVEYELERNRKEEAAMLQIAAAAESGDYDAAHEASMAIPKALSAKGLTISEYYDYEVTNLDEVPLKYKVLSDELVRKHIAKHKPEKPKAVQGLRFFIAGRATRR